MHATVLGAMFAVVLGDPFRVLRFVRLRLVLARGPVLPLEATLALFAAGRVPVLAFLVSVEFFGRLNRTTISATFHEGTPSGIAGTELR